MEVWFQNCRAKWKKQRKRSSMLHSPTSLFPSHSLSPLMPSFPTGWGSSCYTGGCLILFVKLIYSQKATKFWKISTVNLSYVVTVKSTVEIWQNFVAFSEYMNFIISCFNGVCYLANMIYVAYQNPWK